VLSLLPFIFSGYVGECFFHEFITAVTTLCTLLDMWQQYFAPTLLALVL